MLEAYFTDHRHQQNNKTINVSEKISKKKLTLITVATCITTHCSNCSEIICKLARIFTCYQYNTTITSCLFEVLFASGSRKMYHKQQQFYFTFTQFTIRPHKSKLKLRATISIVGTGR